MQRYAIKDLIRSESKKVRRRNVESYYKGKIIVRSRSVQDIEYSFNLDLYGDVIPEVRNPYVFITSLYDIIRVFGQESIQHLTSRSFVFILLKKDKDITYWPRLSKQEGKLPFVETDFNRWVDEDEQNNNISNELVRQFIVSVSCSRF